jgi:hypothetical protein
MLWSQFSAIFAYFRRKNRLFSQKPLLWSLFSAKVNLYSSQKRRLFRQIFLRNVFFLNHNIGPRSAELQKCGVQVCAHTQNGVKISRDCQQWSLSPDIPFSLLVLIQDFVQLNNSGAPSSCCLCCAQRNAAKIWDKNELLFSLAANSYMNARCLAGYVCERGAPTLS